MKALQSSLALLLALCLEWEKGVGVEKAQSGGFSASARRWSRWIGSGVTPIHPSHSLVLAENLPNGAPSTPFPTPRPILKTVPELGRGRNRARGEQL